jgi:hypothetical protein
MCMVGKKEGRAKGAKGRPKFSYTAVTIAPAAAKCYEPGGAVCFTHRLLLRSRVPVGGDHSCRRALALIGDRREECRAELTSSRARGGRASGRHWISCGGDRLAPVDPSSY